MLQVPNALQDEQWKDNPDVAINMIFYLGIPLVWPDKQIFGTICVLDDRTREFSKPYQDLLYLFKENIESDFQIIQQNEKLSESHEMLGTVMSSLDAIVYVADMKTYEILFINKYTKDTFGDIVGKTCWKTLQVGQSGPCDFCTNDKLVDAQGKPADIYEWEHYNDNTRRWYSICDRAIPWSDGRIVRLEIALDITKNKEDESERMRLLNIIESSLNEIYVLDAETLHFIHVNMGALRNLGYTFEEMQSMTALDIKPEYDERSFKKLVRPLLHDEKDIIKFETVHLRADGSIYPVEVHLQLIRNSGEPVFLSVILDITECKQAEEALNESEERYRTIFETTGTAMLIGEEDTTISMINAEFEKLCGYSKEEVEGKKSWIEFIVKADLDRMKECHHLRMIDPNAAPPYYEFQFIDKKGYIKDCFITLDLIPGTKKTVGSLIDITERKQAEEELQERMNELETFYRTTLGREERVIELKQEVNELLEQLGKNKKYRDYS